MVVTGTTSSGSSYDDTSYVTTNDSQPIDNSASDTATLIQQENDINAMNASMAAAEQQNEAAQQQFLGQQQQTIQTEINAMPVDNSNQW